MSSDVSVNIAGISGTAQMVYTSSAAVTAYTTAIESAYTSLQNLFSTNTPSQSDLDNFNTQVTALRSLFTSGMTDPTSQQTVYITSEMAQNLQTLFNTLNAVGVNVSGLPPTSNGSLQPIEMSPAQLTAWQTVYLENGSLDPSNLFNSASLTLAIKDSQNINIQSLIELQYVENGNTLLSNQLQNLQTALAVTKTSLDNLADLQRLHNLIQVNDKTPFSATFNYQLSANFPGAYQIQGSAYFNSPLVPQLADSLYTSGYQGASAPTGTDALSPALADIFKGMTLGINTFGSLSGANGGTNPFGLTALSTDSSGVLVGGGSKYIDNGNFVPNSYYYGGTNLTSDVNGTPVNELVTSITQTGVINADGSTTSVSLDPSATYQLLPDLDYSPEFIARYGLKEGTFSVQIPTSGPGYGLSNATFGTLPPLPAAVTRTYYYIETSGANAPAQAQANANTFTSDMAAVKSAGGMFQISNDYYGFDAATHASAANYFSQNLSGLYYYSGTTAVWVDPSQVNWNNISLSSPGVEKQLMQTISANPFAYSSDDIRDYIAVPDPNTGFLKFIQLHQLFTKEPSNVQGVIKLQSLSLTTGVGLKYNDTTNLFSTSYNLSGMITARNKLLDEAAAISGAIHYLSTHTPPLANGAEDPNSLLGTLRVVLKDMRGAMVTANKTAITSTMSMTSSFNGFYNWLIDGYDAKDVSKQGTYQTDITTAITAGESLNDQQKQSVTNYLYLFQQYYQSAANILSALTQIIEKMAQSIRN